MGRRTVVRLFEVTYKQNEQLLNGEFIFRTFLNSK